MADDEPKPQRVMLFIAKMAIDAHARILKEQLDKDIVAFNDLNTLDKVYVNAFWRDRLDALGETLTASDERATTNEGKLELIYKVFGEEWNLPGHDVKPDVAKRLEWTKRRLSEHFEQEVRQRINGREIVSPIEQIFLIEWDYISRTELHGLRIVAQQPVQTVRGDFKVDFQVIADGGTRVSVAIELDGHEFHEKTKEQAEHDKRRERAIQHAGHTVLRFTGSEVVRNPSACVREVLDFIRSRLDEGR